MKTKKVIWDNKEYEITLGPKEISEMEHDVDFYKLNGFSEEYFINNMPFSYSDWPEEALEMFRNRPAPKLVEGMGCTVNLWSDRLAATVVKVVSPKKVIIRENKTKCKDFYASSYDILDELEGEEQTYTLRKKGGWVAEGQPNKYGSVTLTMGHRHHYIDPSF